MFCIYKIYYKDTIVYVGRTNNIENRIRQHILKNKNIDVNKITKIEFAEVETEADMNFYELYYILKYKPILNSKDTTKDELTIQLDELEFRPFYSYKYESWKDQANKQNRKAQEIMNRKNEIRELLKTETSTMAKDILQTQYDCLKGLK